MIGKGRQTTIAYLELLKAEKAREIADIDRMLAMMGLLDGKQRRRLRASLDGASRLVNGNGNGNGHHPPTKARKSELTRLVLETLARRPLPIADLVLKLNDHGITKPNQLAGPTAKWVSAGWLKRLSDGSFKVTAAGERRLVELVETE